jgi:sec-independent protein translocase protein TatB|tara:strand:+ start:12 stop:248 length:237 start_codon:yes stop_codon:yes gene_type:complete
MPQIGWFEILIIVILSILIIGPKDFPVVLRKIGTWIGSVKRYFSEIQNEVTDIKDTFDKDILIDEDPSEKIKENKKNE